MGKAKAAKVKRYSAGSVDAGEYLEALKGQTFGRVLNSIRYYDRESLAAFAKRLGISAAHLCDIEKGRRVVSPKRAIRWARVLKNSEPYFVQLALQGALNAVGLKLKVRVGVPITKRPKRKRGR
jgi:plasmid maintenance system antidote protein VapI